MQLSKSQKLVMPRWFSSSRGQALANGALAGKTVEAISPTLDQSQAVLPALIHHQYLPSSIRRFTMVATGNSPFDEVYSLVTPITYLARAVSLIIQH